MDERQFEKLPPEILLLVLAFLNKNSVLNFIETDKFNATRIDKFNIFKSVKENENQLFFNYFKNEKNSELKKAFMKCDEESKTIIQIDVKNVFDEYKNKIKNREFDDLKIKDKIRFYRNFTDLNGNINQDNYIKIMTSFQKFLSNLKYRIVFCVEPNSVLKGAVNQYKNNNNKDFTLNKRINGNQKLFFDVDEMQNQGNEKNKFISIFVFPENFFEQEDFIHKTTYYNPTLNSVSHHIYHVDTRYRMFTFQLNQKQVLDINQERYPELDVALTKDLNQSITEEIVKAFLEPISALQVCRMVN